MSPQAATSRTQASIAGHAVVLETLADADRDDRLATFWNSVCDLIFAESRSPERKRRILERYARVLAIKGESHLADLADRLAGSYSESTAGMADWA